MIDPILSRLAGDLRAAEDTLSGPDFGARQARLVALEQEVQDALARLDAERETLAASLEADEGTYENAQNALTAYIAANYLESVGGSDENDDALFEEAADVYQPSLLEQQHLAAAKAQWHARFGDMPQPIEPLPTDEDEYASAKANGAMS